MNTNPRYFDFPEESYYFPKYCNMSERDWSDYHRFDYNVGVSTTEMEEGTNSTHKLPSKYASKFLRRVPSRRRLGPWHRSRRYFKKTHHPSFYSDDAFYGPWPVRSSRQHIQVYSGEIGSVPRPVRARRSSLALLKRQPSFMAAAPSAYFMDEQRSRSNSSRIKLAVPQGCRLQLGLRPIDLDLTKDQQPSGLTGVSESRLRRKRGESRRSNSELSVDISVEMEAISKEIDGIMSNNVLDIMMGQKVIDQKLMELMNNKLSGLESKPSAHETLTEEQTKLLATDKPPLEDLSKIPLSHLKPRPPKYQTINSADSKFENLQDRRTHQTIGSEEHAVDDTKENLYEQMKAEVVTRVECSAAKVTTATNTHHVESKNSKDTQYDEEDIQEFIPSLDYTIPKLLTRYDEMVNVSKIDKNTNWREQLLSSRSEKGELGDYLVEGSEISSKPTDNRFRTSETKKPLLNPPSECTILQSSSAESRPDATLSQPSKTTMTTDISRTVEPTCFKLLVRSIPLDDVNVLAAVNDDNHFECGEGDGIPLQRALGSIAMSDKELRQSRGKNVNCFTEKNQIFECLCEEFKSTTGFCDGAGDSSFTNERISNNLITEQEQSDEIPASYLTINDVNDNLNGFTTMETAVIIANLRKLVEALETSTPVLGKESDRVSNELRDALNTRTKTIKRLENQIETLDSISSLLLTLGVTGYVSEKIAVKES